MEDWRISMPMTSWRLRHLVSHQRRSMMPELQPGPAVSAQRPGLLKERAEQAEVHLCALVPWASTLFIWELLTMSIYFEFLFQLLFVVLITFISKYFCCVFF